MHSDRLGTCIKEIQGKYAKNYFGLRGLFTCGSGYLVSVAQMIPIGKDSVWSNVLSFVNKVV